MDFMVRVHVQGYMNVVWTNWRFPWSWRFVLSWFFLVWFGQHCVGIRRFLCRSSRKLMVHLCVRPPLFCILKHKYFLFISFVGEGSFHIIAGCNYFIRGGLTILPPSSSAMVSCHNVVCEEVWGVQTLVGVRFFYLCGFCLSFVVPIAPFPPIIFLLGNSLPCLLDFDWLSLGWNASTCGDPTITFLECVLLLMLAIDSRRCV